MLKTLIFRFSLFFCLLSLITAGCGGGGDGDGSTDAGDASGSGDTSLNTDTAASVDTKEQTQTDKGTPPPPVPFEVKAGLAQENIEFKVDGVVRAFRLFTPSDYSADKSWPVVFLMHPGTPTHNPEQSPQMKLADALVGDGYVLVEPRGAYTGQGYSWLANIDKTDKYIEELVGFLQGEMNLDAKRTYLVGTHDAGQYVASATKELGDVFSGFAFLDGNQQNAPNVAALEKNRIYMSVGLYNDPTMTWTLNFADALTDGGWARGTDFEVNLYPGSNPARWVHIRKAVAWLDAPFATHNNTGVNSPPDPLLFSQTGETTYAITKIMAGKDGELLAVGTRGTMLTGDGSGTWTEVTHTQQGRDLYSLCFDGEKYWVGATENFVQTGAPETGFSNVTNLFLKKDANNRAPGVTGIDCAESEIWIGAASDVAVSSDGGSSWTVKGGFLPKPGSGAGIIVDIVRSGTGMGALLALDGTVYQSTDAGVNWNETEPLYDAGDWYQQFKSTLGSVPWQAMTTISAPSADSLVVVGMAGEVRLSGTDGAWAPSTLPAGFAPTSGTTDGEGEFFCTYFDDANNGCIGGAAGSILQTSDGGQTWTQVETNLYHLDFSAIYCAGDLILASAKGQIFSNKDPAFASEGEGEGEGEGE